MARREITDEQYQADMNAAAEAGARAAVSAMKDWDERFKASAPPVLRVEPAQQLTEEEAFAKALRKEPADRTPIPQRRQACVTEDGVRFTAVINPSRRYKAGIVVSFEDYQYPEDAETKVAKDGQTPNGLQIKKPNGEYTTQFKQWRWTTFYQRDLKAYVGRDASLLPRTPEPAAAAAE